VAPGWLLVRSMLGAPLRSAVAEPSAGPRTPARGAVHPDRGSWGFALDMAAARPASVRVDALTARRSAPLGTAVPAADSRREPRAGGAGRLTARSGAADGRGAALRSAGSPGTLEPLLQRTPGPSLAEPLPVSARRIHAVEDPDAFRPGADPAIPWAEAPPWTAPSSEASASHRRLPQREATGSPAALKSVVDVTEALRSFVVQEVRELKDAVARAPAPQPPPPASLVPSDDIARKLLNRMRTLMQEERFRSGKIR
jgi:hypothetical protein